MIVLLIVRAAPQHPPPVVELAIDRFLRGTTR